jgi:hypothetical protein
MKTNCSEIERLIVEDLDQSFPPEKRALLEEHLAHCPSCKASHEEYKSLFAVISGDVPPDPGPEYWERYERTLKWKLYDKQEARKRKFTFTWGLGWNTAAAFALSLALIVGGLSILFDKRSPVRQSISPAVISELDSLFGPDQDEGSGVTPEVALGEEVGLKNGDLVISWFEVEDENSGYLL